MVNSQNKTEKCFFEKQTLSSRVKASIVSEYFPKYCKIIVKKHVPERIGYFDLFAGPDVKMTRILLSHKWR